MRALVSLNHPSITEDNFERYAFIDGHIDVEMEVFEEDVIFNDGVGSMRDSYFNFNNPQEVHEGKYLVYVGVNAGAPSNYFFTYQMTEVDQHLLCVPTHGPGEDRENILQYYAIFDSLFPRILMHTLRN